LIVFPILMAFHGWALRLCLIGAIIALLCYGFLTFKAQSR